MGLTKWLDPLFLEKNMFTYKDKPNRLISSTRTSALLSESSSNINIPGLVEFLRSDFALDWRGIHGSPHWARVLNNGTILGKAEGARLDVITLFAFLHDHKRIHDSHDTEHGKLAVESAKNLRGVFFKIDDTGFDLLCEAMENHSDGVVTGDITVKCCYDADRLDLGRVGIMPKPIYLCTETAKSIIAECYERSIR